MNTRIPHQYPNCNITLFAHPILSLWRFGLMAVVFVALALFAPSFAHAQCNITISPAALPAGTIDAFYSQPLTASGSGGPFTFSIVGGSLPPNITLSPSGLLSGTPLVHGSFPFTVLAMTPTGCFGTNFYTLTINCPTITINPPTLPNFSSGSPYGPVPLTASGGSPPYFFSLIGGSLPAGMTLSSGGVLSGTPTTTVPACFTIQAMETNGCVGIMSYCITNTTPTNNCPPITINPPTLPNFTVGTPYGPLPLAANGGIPPYTFSVIGGSLPAGMTLSSGGVLSGTPTSSTPECFTIQASQANGCTGIRSYCISNSCPTITINPPTLPNFTVGTLYGPIPLTASGGNPPYTFSIISGSLPAGMTLSSGGVLGGTPTSSTPECFTIQATQTNGCSGIMSYCISNICPTITINPPTLPNFTVGMPYGPIPLTASGGNPPYFFSVIGGSLPAGLTLSSGGVLGGTPTSPTPECFTIQATQTNGCSGIMSYCVTNISGGCVPPPTNMVLWLPFDETSGNTSANLVSPANPGTQVNNPVPLLGQYVDNSLTFSGTNYVSVPDYPDIEIGTNDLTIDAWIYQTGPMYNDQTNVIVSKLPGLVGAPGYALMVCTNKGLIFDIDGNIFTENSPISAGQWHFVAVSLSQSQGQGYFYVDGQVVGAFALPGPMDLSNPIPLWVGSAFYAFSIPFNNSGITSWVGALDEVEVFNRALFPNELDTIFGAGTAGKCKPCISLQVQNIVTNTCQSCVVVPFNALATDFCCSNVTLTYDYPTNFCFPVNTTTPVQVIATDDCGNAATNYFTVTVLPCQNTNCLTLTVLTSNLVVSTCGDCAPITFSNVQAYGQGWVSNVVDYTDVCCTNVSVAYYPSNACFPVGTFTPVQVTVYDDCGNVASGQFTVTVIQGNCTTNPPCTNGVTFVDFSTNSLAGTGLQFNGSAVAPVIGMSGTPVLRLTPANTFQAGSAFVPVQLDNNLNFSAEFSFQITNGGPASGGSNDGNEPPAPIGADGICFVMANAPTDVGLLGGAGAGVGYSGIPTSVAIKFDTWEDSAANGFPQENDPSGNFVAVYTDGGVNTAGYLPYSPLNPGTTPQFYVPSTYMKNGDIWYAWINYSGANSELDVYLSDGSNVRPPTPQLVQSISLDNLSILGLGPQFYAGFTAGTGGQYDTHDILNWQFSSPCTNTCLSIACSNIVAYTCDTNCLNVPFTATPIDTCCSNVTLRYYLGTNSTSPANNCFPVNSTNTVTVVASDDCGNVVTNYFNVAVVHGPGYVGISYQFVGNKVILTWSQGILQSSPTLYSLANNQSVEGPYSDVQGAVSPYITEAVGATTFYRLRCPCPTCTNCLVLNCPTNITVITCAGCTNIPFENYVGVEDNCCTNWNLTFNFPTNYCFPVDTTNTVQVTLSDKCGNRAIKSFQIIVLPCGNTNVPPGFGMLKPSILRQQASACPTPVGDGSRHSFTAGNWPLDNYNQLGRPTTNAGDFDAARIQNLRSRRENPVTGHRIPVGGSNGIRC